MYKIKNASFSLYINNFNPDFHFFFYEVIILLRARKSQNIAFDIVRRAITLESQIMRTSKLLIQRIKQ